MMTKRQKIQATNLGIAISTAKHRLDRIIMFSLIGRLNINICFRCKKPMTVNNFSIEHKIPWLHDPDAKNLYFDLNNIDFSHNSCNQRFRRIIIQPGWNKGKITHGTSGYRSGCRCHICKSIYSENRKDRYAKLRGRSQTAKAATSKVVQL